MYSFQTGSSKRKSQKTIRILSVVIFVLAVALIGLTVSYLRASSASRTTSDALHGTRHQRSQRGADRRLSAHTVQRNQYHDAALPMSAAHIYAHAVPEYASASNIYGAGTVIVEHGSMHLRLHHHARRGGAAVRRAGSVLTESMTELRDEVDAIVALFNAAENAETEISLSARLFRTSGLSLSLRNPPYRVNQLFRFRRRVHQPRTDAHCADIQRSQKRCTPGAQCSPPRTAIFCSSSAAATTCEAIPSTLKLSSDAPSFV